MKTATHNRLIAKFHVLVGKLPNPEVAKEQVLASYNVSSSKYLTDAELVEACNAIERQMNPRANELDKWRKRLIASIGGWLKAMNKYSDINLIKGIACRASGRASFNAIPLEQLRSLYAAFTKKAKDMHKVEDLTAVEVDFLQTSN